MAISPGTADGGVVWEPYTHADSPPEDYRELLRKAISYRIQAPTKHGPRSYLWSLVGEMLCVGSTRASRICKDLGFDPDQLVKAYRRK